MRFEKQQVGKLVQNQNKSAIKHTMPPASSNQPAPNKLAHKQPKIADGHNFDKISSLSTLTVSRKLFIKQKGGKKRAMFCTIQNTAMASREKQLDDAV